MINIDKSIIVFERVIMQKTTWQDLLRPGDATDFFQRRYFPDFEPNTEAYSLPNALWLAELSRIVYRHDREEDTPPPTQTQTDILANNGFKQRIFFRSGDTDTQAILVQFGEVPTFAVLAFRGTEQTLKDLATDANIGKVPLAENSVDVHDGFQIAIDSVWKMIEPELKKLTCPLFYTGHSLGAALATLAAAKHPPKAVYTFGSPRVGNQDFINSLRNVQIYRIVDDEDFVTTVPPVFMGFRHVGEEHRLLAPEEEFSYGHAFNPPKLLADHAPINYIDRLK